MAKTLAQLLSDTRQHISQTESSNSQFSNTILTGWLNEAYRKFVSVRRHLPIQDREYAVDGATVTLNSLTAKVDYAKIKNPDNGNKYSPMAVITFDQLMEMDPDYENATSDLPRYLVMLGYTSARLYPSPKASVQALTTPLKTHGLEMPSALSSDSDTPALRDVDQDALPFWPAYRVFSQLEMKDKATEFLILWRGALKELGHDTSFSKHQNGFRWPGSGGRLGLAAGYAPEID